MATAPVGCPPRPTPTLGLASPGFPSSPRGLCASSWASCCFLLSALAACSCRSLFSCAGWTRSCDPSPYRAHVPARLRTAPPTFRARTKRSRKVFMVLNVSSRDSCWASSHR